MGMDQVVLDNNLVLWFDTQKKFGWFEGEVNKRLEGFVKRCLETFLKNDQN